MNPLVSICIPTYNGAKFIAEAMDSAIKQTYSNLEIVVSDDDSKDETLSIIEAYKTKTSIPVSIYNHEPNGIGANWNNCLNKSKGDYVRGYYKGRFWVKTITPLEAGYKNMEGVFHIKRPFSNIAKNKQHPLVFRHSITVH